MRDMVYDVAAVTDIGKIRDNNEDNFCVNGFFLKSGEADGGRVYSKNLRSPLVVCVCDGMGGEACGEIAALTAVGTISRLHGALSGDASVYEDKIAEYIQQANENVCDEIEHTKSNMGTTLSLVCLHTGGFIAANIGDSRIYRFSGGALTQLSADHTELQRRLNAGINVPEHMHMLLRSRLTQHLGIFSDEMLLEPEVITDDEVRADDIFLLCSDGLTDMLTDSEIAGVLSERTSSQSLAKKLISQALARGGRDNVTVIVAKQSEKRI